MGSVLTALEHRPLDWFGFLASLGFLVMGVYDGLKYFRRGSRKTLSEPFPLPEQTKEESPEWIALCARADLVIKTTQAELPPAIVEEAKLVAWVYKERAEKESPGYTRMGEYHGFRPGHKSDHNGPIVLFLKSIEEACAGSGENFSDKVKFVYLHELGHHFGWDEVDLVRWAAFR